MKRFIFVFIIFIQTLRVMAQEVPNTKVDSLYREDQFFFGITYNLLLNKPDNVKQNAFSAGFHLGFIRDMPINKRRNLAIGLGLGFSTNSYNENLLITKLETGIYNYEILPNAETYRRNKISNNIIEVPLEFRWRSSTYTEYKFWRIYSGFKFGYVISDNAKHRGDIGDFDYGNIEDLNEFQYGLTLGVGYNTWNFYAYYGLNSILTKDAVLNGNSIDMSALQIGLMFYLL